jgi:hypothetical protein
VNMLIFEGRVFEVQCIIQGYHKRNRQFQHFIEPKLFKISTFSIHGFVEKLWKFTTNRMEHRPIGTGKLEIISMQIVHSAGLAAQQATCHSHVGHLEVPI